MRLMTRYVVGTWLSILLFLSVFVGLGMAIGTAHATESVDQFIDRMRMRRDSVPFQNCLREIRLKAEAEGTKPNVDACVPPDYGTEQEAWKSGEWVGTEEESQ